MWASLTEIPFWQNPRPPVMSDPTAPTRRMLLAASGGAALALFAGPLAGQHVYKEVHELKPNAFTWHPERQPAGPVAIGPLSCISYNRHLFMGLGKTYRKGIMKMK